jgi:curved DNA-binding protein CbpA
MVNTRAISENYKLILNESDPYIILGVDNQSSLEEISKKYKDFAKEFHPDRHTSKSNQEKKEIEEIFTKITSAFNILKDPEQRKRYDYELEVKKVIAKAKNLADPKQTTCSFDPRKTIAGGFTLNQGFTDNKFDAKELKNNKAELNFQNGLDKLRKGQLDLAITDFQAAIELNGNLAKYHSNLGLAMLQKGWNGYAQAEFKVALSIDPEDKIAKQNNSFTNNNITDNNKKQTESGIISKVKNLFKKS